MADGWAAWHWQRFDTHNWLVAMAAEGGPPPDERQGPGAAGHAALIAGDQVIFAPSRGSDPVLFGLRRARLATALAWAARLLQLPRRRHPRAAADPVPELRHGGCWRTWAPWSQRNRAPGPAVARSGFGAFGRSATGLAVR